MIDFKALHRNTNGFRLHLIGVYRRFTSDRLGFKRVIRVRLKPGSGFCLGMDGLFSWFCPKDSFGGFRVETDVKL